MIKFNELRISRDESNLIIDVQIEDNSYFTNCYLQSISIDTQDKYVKADTYKGPVFYMEFDNSAELKPGITPSSSTDIGTAVDPIHIKSKKLILTGVEKEWNDFVPDFSNNMFIVTIKAGGTPSSDTPCSMQDNIIYGATFSLCKPYTRFLNSMKEVDKSCEIPMNFINDFLEFKAVTIAISTGDMNLASKNYVKYIQGIKQEKITKCNCNG